MYFMYSIETIDELNKIEYDILYTVTRHIIIHIDI